MFAAKLDALSEVWQGTQVWPVHQILRLNPYNEASCIA
jgi:hypothetical protein